MSTAMPSVVKLIRDMWAKTGMSELVINWVRLAPNGVKSGIFKISFQYILAPRAKMYWKLILKISKFVSICAILNHF